MRTLLLRSLERLLALFIGALSIYLGYSLFIRLADLSLELAPGNTGEGEIVLPGIKIVLSQVGPGVFFALFGATIILLSLRMQMKYTRQDISVAPSSPKSDEAPEVTNRSATTVALTYLAETEHLVDDQEIQAARSRFLRDFRTIDRVCSTIAEVADDGHITISKNDRTDFLNAVPRLKEAAMLAIWDADWGDYATFSAWVRAGRSDPPPKRIEAPARFYIG